MEATPRQSPMWSRIDPVEKRGITLAECGHGFRTTSREPFLSPNLVEATRIAPISANEIAAAHLKPARDPDVDRVLLGQRTAGNGRGWFSKKRLDHDGGTLDGGPMNLFMPAKLSNLVAEFGRQRQDFP